MNKNIDLTKILKDCPKGTEFYSCIYGKVRFDCLQSCEYPVLTIRGDGLYASFSRVGKYTDAPDSECCLFPSKDQRDWSKFEAPWHKKDKFDPKTLKPFDKVLIRRGSENYNVWSPDFVSEPPNGTNNNTLCMCVGEDIAMVIPYNDDTKHLVGTTEEASEYYRYWED